MNICLICKSPKRAAVDERLLAGGTHASVARALGFDRQVVGRHARNGHVKKGNPAAGTAWMKPEPAQEPPVIDEETFVRLDAAATALAAAVHGVGPAALAEHEAHDALTDDCPLVPLLVSRDYDWLLDAAIAYAERTGAPLAYAQD